LFWRKPFPKETKHYERVLTYWTEVKTSKNEAKNYSGMKTKLSYMILGLIHPIYRK
jgi:hypothetical protein